MTWSDNIDKIIMIGTIIFGLWIYLELKAANLTSSIETTTT